MKIKNAKAWKAMQDANKDSGYVKACIEYAERWANLMEEQLKNEHTLSSCAEQTSNEADIEGITGFMYGVAVSILAKVWTHGEELRRWHNLSVQIRDEGEKANKKSGAVLNPALLS